ncbi:MAG: hypothetical protein DLM70_05285 [Chloroflexi bacterium]|nr:MAG: hypothetical protein DLM70_05285 [Chloroflexota bacterium]
MVFCEILSSPHVVLAISQENYNELDAFLAHRDVPGVRRSLRAFSGLSYNKAKPPLPLISETPHLS